MVHIVALPTGVREKLGGEGYEVGEAIDGGFLKRLLGGKSELETARNDLDRALKRILEGEPTIRFVDGA